MNKKKQKLNKLRRLYAALCLLSSLVFLASAGITLAQWRRADETVNTLSVGTVRGVIIGYEDTENTLSVTDTVAKEAYVQNIGDLDACVRVKVDKYWGHERTAEGKLVADPDVSTENIKIAYNTDDWYRSTDDGYYYYKGITAAPPKHRL